MYELEVWLIGTPRQLHAAEKALSAIGHVVQPTDPAYRHMRQRLGGADSGRWRMYARIAVANAIPASPRGTNALPLTELATS
jgi:hypothetical protein